MPEAQIGGFSDALALYPKICDAQKGLKVSHRIQFFEDFREPIRKPL